LSIAVTSLFFAYSCKNAQAPKPETVKNNGVKSTITDEQLMDKVQKDALKYFWDYAEPNSCWEENVIMKMIFIRIMINTLLQQEAQDLDWQLYW
jgi:hypothetical protein